MHLENLLRPILQYETPRGTNSQTRPSYKGNLLSPRHLDRMFLLILRRIQNLRLAVLHVEKMTPPSTMAILVIPDTIMPMANVLSKAKPSSIKSYRKEVQDQLAQCYLQKTPRSPLLCKSGSVTYATDSCSFYGQTAI